MKSGTKSGKTGGSSNARFRARLTLEALDLRLPPSSLIGDGTDTPVVVPPLGTDPAVLIAAADSSAGGASSTGNTPSTFDETPVSTAPAANGPQIINFQGAQISGGLYTFTGQVVDPAPAGLTITFGGAPQSLQGKKVTTDANGNFSLSIVLKLDGTDSGTASAQTVNNQGVASNVALTYVNP